MRLKPKKLPKMRCPDCTGGQVLKSKWVLGKGWQKYAVPCRGCSKTGFLPTARR